MNQTSTLKRYLKKVLSAAGRFLLLFLAIGIIMFVLDKVGLDREIIKIVLLPLVFIAIYWYLRGSRS